MVTDGGGIVTVTFADFASEQPAAVVTVTFSVSVPTAPAVKVMLFVPAPPGMEPLVIDQAYVAPAPAEATEAGAEEPVTMLPPAVIVAFGFGLIVTVEAAEAALVQPDDVTRTL